MKKCVLSVFLISYFSIECSHPVLNSNQDRNFPVGDEINLQKSNLGIGLNIISRDEKPLIRRPLADFKGHNLLVGAGWNLAYLTKDIILNYIEKGNLDFSQIELHPDFSENCPRRVLHRQLPWAVESSFGDVGLAFQEWYTIDENFDMQPDFVGTFGHLPHSGLLPDSRFNLVVFENVGLSDDESELTSMLSEVYRVLSPGGQAIIITGKFNKQMVNQLIKQSEFKSNFKIADECSAIKLFKI